MALRVATEYIRFPEAAAATAASEGCSPAGGAGSAPKAEAGADPPAGGTAAAVVMRTRMAASGGAGKIASQVRRTLSRFVRSAGRTSQMAQKICDRGSGHQYNCAAERRAAVALGHNAGLTFCFEQYLG